MMMRLCEYSGVTYCPSSLEPRKIIIIGEIIDAVTHKALHAIFKLHPKDMTEDILFGDVGMLPPFLTVGSTHSFSQRTFTEFHIT
jgi:hypothetical protein